jgi:hypothetical protein
MWGTRRGLRAGNFRRDARDFGRPTANLVPWTGAHVRPQRTWAENDGRSPPNDLSLPNRWKGSLKKLPQKVNPEEYGFSVCMRTIIRLGIVPSLRDST